MYEDITKAENIVKQNIKKSMIHMAAITLVTFVALVTMFWQLDRQLHRVAIIDQETIGGQQ